MQHVALENTREFYRSLLLFLIKVGKSACEFIVYDLLMSQVYHL